MNRYHLRTDDVQVSLRCTEAGKLVLTHLGAPLAVPDDAFTAPACEWPLASTDFDSRAQWGNFSGEFAYHLRLPDGTLGWDLRAVEVLQDANTLTARLADPRHPALVLTLTLRLWENGVLTQDATLSNGTEGRVEILRALSAALPMRAREYHITTFRGGWAGENYMREQELLPGNTLSAGSTTGIKCAQEGTPGFVLALDSPAQEECGSCILGALAWSGNYTLSFKHSTYGHLFTGMGHVFSHAPHVLEAGDEITLPTAVLVFSAHGKGDTSRRLHRHLRKHVIPRGEETRRILLNSWEGVHFDVDETTLQAMMQRSAELGVELFVLDDGWFGKRKDDTSSLGDWEPDAEKLPHGLAALTACAQECGIDFGIWMEPEMVSPQSNLYAENPALAVQLPGIHPREERHQLVLDLANPAVSPAAMVSAVLDSAPGISYVKWDCNRKLSDTGSTHLPADMQGNLFFDYIRRYYGGMRQLREQHPGVTFQCCSAGGGRLDLGAAAFHEEFWLSDNTDPHDRLFMQWSALHFLPANAIGCHVTASPNLYTGRETSLKFRFDVALMGRLGLELDPRAIAEADLEEIRARIALAKELRPIVQLGEPYRLVSPYEGPDCALLYRRGSEALLLCYTTERPYTDQHTRIRPVGLNPAARYTVEELLPGKEGPRCPLQGQCIGGDTLLHTGVPIHWNRPHQSCVLRLRECGE